MRRLLMTAVFVLALGAFGSITLPEHSVMAGIQDVVTPVVHAQIGGASWNCDDLFDELSELEFEGQFSFVLTGENDLGPVAYGVELLQYYGIWDGSPFYINCYQSWW